jgi:SAM-dependent methyltransferase
MDLGENSVDAAVCRWGYMLMADPGAALKETRRVLRGGGRLCFAVWMTADRNPWAAIPAITLVQRGHMDPPNPAAPSMFGMGDAARTRELVTAAGFAEPELEEISFSYTYRDFDDFWKAMMQLAGPLARVVEQLPEQEREATRAAVRENVSDHCGQDGSYSFPAASWGVLAR